MVSQAQYASDPATGAGFAAGIAQSSRLNKVWRQASFVGAAVARLVMEQLGEDVFDDGDLAGFVDQLRRGMVALQPRLVIPRGPGGAPGTMNFYVNPASGNDGNDGQTPTTAFLTAQAAANHVIYNVDLAGGTAVVNLAAGSHAPFRMYADPTGQGGSVYDAGGGTPSLVFRGNLADPSQVIINAVENNCVYATGGVNFTCEGITFAASSSGPPGGNNGNGIWVDRGAGAQWRNCIFRAMPGAHVVATNGGFIRSIGSYTIAGGAFQHFFLGGNCTLECGAEADSPLAIPPFVITLTGMPNFGDAFIHASACSVASFSPTIVSFNGTATGRRFLIDQASICETYGGGANYLPGSIAGLVDRRTYGVYDDAMPALREILTHPTSFYCSPNGNDNNDGLTTATAWRTIQHGVNFVQARLDLDGHDVTLELADGDYAPASMFGPLVGGDRAGLVIRGNVGNPAAVRILGTVDQSCLVLEEGAEVSVEGMTYQAIGSGWGGHAITCSDASTINWKNVIFGNCPSGHVVIDWGSGGGPIGNYTISGGGETHISIAAGGRLWWAHSDGGVGYTITLQNNPNFSECFFYASLQALCAGYAQEWTFVGTATGRRYHAETHGVIEVGGNPNFFPGNTPGDPAPGVLGPTAGLYV